MTCVHHWLLEPVTGPYSVSTCIRCGDSRVYGNSEEAALEGKPFGRSSYPGVEPGKTQRALMRSAITRQSQAANRRRQREANIHEEEKACVVCGGVFDALVGGEHGEGNKTCSPSCARVLGKQNAKAKREATG